MLIPVISNPSIAKGSKSFTVRDITGAYDVSTNPGGYGLPNMVSPPVAVGFRLQYLTESTAYANFVSESTSLITNLFSTDGAKIDTTLFGGSSTGNFLNGVHIVKYYPFVLMDSVVQVTNGSPTVEVLSGTQPSVFDENVVAALILDNAGTILSKVLMIDKAATTGTSFKVDTVWAGNTASNYKIMLATEADLKVLFTEVALSCLVQRIGRFANTVHCYEQELLALEKMHMMYLASKISFSSKDYRGAHDSIIQVLERCTGTCNTTQENCNC